MWLVSSLVLPKVVAAMKKWWALLTLLACLKNFATSKSMIRTPTLPQSILMCLLICQLVFTSANSWKKSPKVLEAQMIMLNSTRSTSLKSWKMRVLKTCNFVFVKSGSTNCTTSVMLICKRHLAQLWCNSSDLKLTIKPFKFLTTVLLLVALLTNFLTTKKEESICHASVHFIPTARTNWALYLTWLVLSVRLTVLTSRNSSIQLIKIVTVTRQSHRTWLLMMLYWRKRPVFIQLVLKAASILVASSPTSS